MIEICKWKNNANSPALFFIDDLANVWVDTNGNDALDLGEDWGYWKDAENSSMKFLEEKVLVGFPNVKVTFFVPVGERVGIISNPKIKSISKKINSDPESIKFFKGIHENPKYELTYHGTSHGIVGDTVYNFTQEWESYNSLDEALEITKIGKDIFKETVGEYPVGGKYCGYASNNFSDESIDQSGFIWWCRYWNRGSHKNPTDVTTGNDINALSNFDIKFFGENNVVDIPSTINGGLLTGILNPNLKTLRGLIKRILKIFLIKIKLSQIDYLIEKKLVISIQEHIAPSRDDGRIQTPNIFNDIKSLKMIFSYLNKKNVWYCTCSELAEYVLVRENLDIHFSNHSSFKLKIKDRIKGKIKSKKNEITLKINDSDFTHINLPDNSSREIKNSIINLPILEGEYELI